MTSIGSCSSADAGCDATSLSERSISVTLEMVKMSAIPVECTCKLINDAIYYRLSGYFDRSLHELIGGPNPRGSRLGWAFDQYRIRIRNVPFSKPRYLEEKSHDHDRLILIWEPGNAIYSEIVIENIPERFLSNVLNVVNGKETRPGKLHHKTLSKSS